MLLKNLALTTTIQNVSEEGRRIVNNNKPLFKTIINKLQNSINVLIIEVSR